MADDWTGERPPRPLEDIRAMHDEVRAVEERVSNVRTIMSVRGVVVAADLRRRSEGGSPIDLDTIIEQLPDILSDKGSAGGGPGRLPSGLMAPDDTDLTIEIDQVAGPDELGHLADLSDDAVAELARN